MATTESTQIVDNNNNYWQCNRCTLLNNNKKTKCEACDNNRDEEQKRIFEKEDGYRIQGIYYQKQRAHRLQNNKSDQGGNIWIALCNLLFLKRKLVWIKPTKRVSLDELKQLLVDTLNEDDINKIIKDLNIKLFYANNNKINNLDLMYCIIDEDEVCILCRDNIYYSTIVKHFGILYEFITFESMIDIDPQITWKTLLTISGNNEQVTNNKFGQTHIIYQPKYENNNNDKLLHISIIKKTLNEILLTLNDNDVDKLECVLFNFSYICGLPYKNESYLMYLINVEHKILFDGFIKNLQIETKMRLPKDVKNLCFKYNVDDTLSQLISLFDHQHISVCYPAALSIHNIIKLENNQTKTKTIKHLIDCYEILNKFHNLICIDSGPNIKKTAYSAIEHICKLSICIENIMNDGLIITLIERVSDISNFKNEYKQCLKILNVIITNNCNNNNKECILYLIENGIIDAICPLIKSDQEHDVYLVLNILNKMLKIDNSIIKYISNCNSSLLSLKNLISSNIKHISNLATNIIEKYCCNDGSDTKCIDIILYKLGLNKYCQSFQEFGIDYHSLNHLEAPIVEFLINDQTQREQFMVWLINHQKQQQEI